MGLKAADIRYLWPAVARVDVEDLCKLLITTLFVLQDQRGVEVSTQLEMLPIRRTRELLTDGSDSDDAVSPASVPAPPSPEYPTEPAFTEYRTVVKSQADLEAAVAEGAAHIELQDHVIVLAGALGLPPFWALPALLSLRVRFMLCAFCSALLGGTCLLNHAIPIDCPDHHLFLQTILFSGAVCAYD